MNGSMSTDQSKNTPQHEQKPMCTVWGVPIKKPPTIDILVLTTIAIGAFLTYAFILTISLLPTITPVSVWYQHYVVITAISWGTLAGIFDIDPRHGWKHARLWATITGIIAIIGFLLGGNNG